MKRASNIMLNGIILLSLSAAVFFSSAEKFLKSVPETVNIAGQVSPVVTSKPEEDDDIIIVAQTEWIDSGIHDQNEEYSLFFTRENPKIDSKLNVTFSFMIQVNGGKKVEMSDRGKPNGMFFNRIIETWSLDCLSFSGHRLSGVYIMNDSIIYSRRLDTRHKDIGKVEKLTVFPDTDSYNAAKYYCGK